MTSTHVRETALVLQPGVQDVAADVRRRITETFQLSGDIDARRIHVGVDGDRATLTGTVTTSLQRWAAEYAALDSPGIARVDNRLVVWPREAELAPSG
jgi:osmotically-inducible protein OsmY